MENGPASRRSSRPTSPTPWMRAIASGAETGLMPRPPRSRAGTLAGARRYRPPPASLRAPAPGAPLAVGGRPSPPASGTSRAASGRVRDGVTRRELRSWSCRHRSRNPPSPPPRATRPRPLGADERRAALRFRARRASGRPEAAGTSAAGPRRARSGAERGRDGAARGGRASKQSTVDNAVAFSSLGGIGQVRPGTGAGRPVLAPAPRIGGSAGLRPLTAGQERVRAATEASREDVR